MSRFALMVITSLVLLPSQAPAAEAYPVGSDDTLLIRSPQIKELDEKRFTVSKDGFVDLPLAGKIQATGMETPQLATEIEKAFRRYYHEPHVSIEIAEYRSQPVSVLGAVANPGIYQLQGRKALADVLSLAGGLKPDAGYSVRVSRRSSQSDGPQEHVVSYPLTELLRGDLSDTDVVRPGDVITVPKADLIYVIGDVRKPGGFVLGEKEHMSALQSLALSEGAVATAALSRAVILRDGGKAGDRTSIPVNLKRLIAGKAPDVPLRAGDVLVVPSSNARKIAVKTAEAALQTASGILIWRRP